MGQQSETCRTIAAVVRTRGVRRERKLARAAAGVSTCAAMRGLARFRDDRSSVFP
jgi:hypothetical protein